MDEVVTMYRPVGPKELKLLEDSGFRRWPPRLPEQPIFYPVTNEQYAIEIASRWNVKADDVGYVTKFSVRRSFMERYDIQQVGGAHHTEWWVPADELEQLNDNIVGAIEVIGEYRKQAMNEAAKPMPDGFPLASLDQTGQRISAGDSVTILSVVSCARNLPENHQIHLQSLVGQSRQILELDQYGFVWLSFTATDQKTDFCLFPNEVSKS